MTNSNLNRLPKDWPNLPFSESIQVDHIQWHVQISRHPNPDAEIILLVHGAGSTAHSWDHIFPVLAQNFTVIAPDLPGHGFTKGAYQSKLGTEEVANDLYALLQDLHLLPNILIGHSAGSNVCLDLACSPALPIKLVIGLNPALVAPPNGYKMFLGPLINSIANSSLVSNFLANTLKMTSTIDQVLDSTKSQLTQEQRNRYKLLFKDSNHIHGALGFISAIDIPHLLSGSHQLKCSLSFVVTKQDTWIPLQAVSVVIKDSYPQAELLTLNGGHLFHEENPATALEIIQHAIQKISSKKIDYSNKRMSRQF